MRSERNKTLDIPLAECGEYLCRCVSAEKTDGGDIPENSVVCGDFFAAVRAVADESVDLCIADPPYNLRKDFGGEIFSKRSSEEYAGFTRDWLKELKRILKPSASVYVCCDWETSIVLGAVLGEFFTVRSRITWQREKGRGAAKNWKNSMEDIWFCTVSDDYTFNLDAVKQRRKVKAPYRENGVPKDWDETENGNFRFTCPSNFWDDITVPFWSMAENTAHPTQKPEKLIAKLILASSNENDLVFDPFAGSGTTAVTAKKLGRRYIAVEKNEQYCAWSQIRLEKADTDKRIQGFENGVFIKK